MAKAAVKTNESQANPDSEENEMADPTLVNGQITDGVTQANVTVLGNAPALALGTTFQVAANSASLAMENAVANQQRMNILGEAATAAAVALLTHKGGT